MFGGLRPVQWIGRYPLKKSDPSKPWVKDALPVRIARSALGPEPSPRRSLCDGAHGLLIDGVLAPAEILINGTTITRYEASETDELEYFHVKLESHDVVYAEGVPAETLLERRGKRRQFRRLLPPIWNPRDGGSSLRPGIVHAFGGREELKSRFRSALSPWIDLRNQADVVRDRWRSGGVRASQPAELTSNSRLRPAYERHKISTSRAAIARPFFFAAWQPAPIGSNAALTRTELAARRACAKDCWIAGVIYCCFVASRLRAGWLQRPAKRECS